MRPEVTALFRDLADRSPEERREYYVREGVPDAVRTEVESLLEYDEAGDPLQGCVESAQQLLLEETSTDAGQPATRPPRTALPDLIGRFPVTKLLGRGGMGEVYLARDPVIDRKVAIKVIGSGLDNERGRRRLLREARAAGRLLHSNIVTVFEAGEFEGRLFIAMEYVAGETLGRIIRGRVPLALSRRIEMIEGACAGLAHAHRAGVIHLDIKPDNLMLDESGVVKVLDFGISRVLQSETLASAHGAGTLRYMSPEQIQGKTLNHRSDVFSLGCSMFELLSYSPAFRGIAVGPVPRLCDLSPDFDPRLDRIIQRAMALDPADRYDDLDHMRAELAQVRASLEPTVELSSTSPQAPSTASSSTPRDPIETSHAERPRRTWRSPSRAVIAAGLAIIVMIAAMLFFWN